MKYETLILDRHETALNLEGTELLGYVEKSLIAIADETVSAPPRPAAHCPDGFITVMPGYVPMLGLGAKVTSVFPTDPSGTNTAHRGVVVLFDENDGRPICIMDAEQVTARRTSATTTLAWKALASDVSSPIAILGTGVQARAQLQWLRDIGSTNLIYIAGRSEERVRNIQDAFPGVVAAPMEVAIRSSGSVFCCTGATSPLFPEKWLERNTFLCSIGGSSGTEIGEEIVEESNLYIEWPGAQTSAPPAGAVELQNFKDKQSVLLGEVLSKRLAPAKSGINFFKSTGHAALDIAAARLAYNNAQSLSGVCSVEL